MNTSPPRQKSKDNQHFLSLLNNLLISGMLACLAYVLAKFIPLLYPAWVVKGLPVMAFVVSLESLIMHRSQVGRSRMIENPFLATAAEWIVILILSKAMVMVQTGLPDLWQELLSWQHQFFQNFFDLQYGLMIFVLLVIWGLVRLFAIPLNKLEEDEALMAQEKLGYAFNNRQAARRDLIALIFILGFIMIGLMVFMKGDVGFIPITLTPARTFVSVLLIYFTQAFIFMALNQYAIMKARWFFNDIEVNANLSKRWLFFTLVFIAVVILTIIFLPTDFSIGFYPILMAISEVLIYIFGILQFIILFPIATLLTLLSSLLATEGAQERVQPVLPEFSPAITEVTAALPWWEIVKSVVFWLVFLGVIIVAVRYYLRSQRGLRDLLNFNRLQIWAKDFWTWITHGFRQLDAFTTEIVQKGIQEVQRLLSDRKVRWPTLADLVKGVSPRQAVILTYLDWVRWNERHGLSRRESQTPREFAAAIRTRWPGIEEPLDAFTHQFILARYTREVIEKSQVDKAQVLLDDLQSFIRQADLAFPTDSEEPST